MSWQFWIDRGGTFTDCIGVDPQGRLHVTKRLSSDTAPVEAIHELLERSGRWRPGQPPPAASVKLGTTVATNALLERRGVRTLLVTNRGFGDLLSIGTQERPHLFELEIRRPPPVPELALEIDGRLGADGVRLAALEEEAIGAGLRAARRSGVQSVAIALLHSYLDPADEERVAALAAEAGFSTVARSAEVAREMGLLARAETTVADAYLTPLLGEHARALSDALPGSRLRFMQSSGGLTDAERFRGPGALLSGPAGGVVGAARVAAASGFDNAIGFDMGGTSTDVSLIERGETERGFETLVAGVRVRAPMLRIHTVAAGGGSLCRFDGFRLTVGPESAGASPGPLCYGQPEARELALTDVNLYLGRIRGDRFPFPLEREPVERAFGDLERTLKDAGHGLSAEDAAAGFFEIANASMAQAIQEVSIGRGVDPRDFALVGFGGAGGQHVCAVARRLGMSTILLHPYAGLLSAYGIGLADLSWDRQRDAGRVPLAAAGRVPGPVSVVLGELVEEGRAALAEEGAAAAAVRVERLLDLRYVGTETPLTLSEPEDGDFASAFETEHRARYGYARPGRPLEIVNARVRVRAAEPGAALPALAPGRGAEPVGETEAWFPGLGRVCAPLYTRESLGAGDVVTGPAVVLEGTGTVVLDPGFTGRIEPSGVLRLTAESAPAEAASAATRPPAGTQRGAAERSPEKNASRPHLGDRSPEANASRPPAGAQRGAAERSQDRPDPIRLEVFGNRFMSIAEQMGAVLRKTSVSTNIKERLDYSCAVFDRDGGLVANAPHIPVHLGAMGATVRAVRAAIADLAPGDAIVTNDPAQGGSHLPDVTVVTPVFIGPEPRFFVASRGHHADLGGTTPGSMPADSRTLEEEGVLLRAFPLVRAGRFDEVRLRELLAGAVHPARNPDDNVADLEAMVAANRAGESLLRRMVEEQGAEAVERTMGQLQQAAGQKVAREIARLGDGEHAFEDALDDGTPVCVRLQVSGEHMRIDFTGTGPASPGNLNAPRAVVESAVIYVLRALVAERIPLNGGCLAPVEIVIPPGCLLDPPPGSAVVGGNVETSQRVVDVLLGAIGRVAASQGSMNNVAFGDARFGYYETIGGGAGAGDGFAGASGVHTHMTNTRITDVEVLESRTPVRVVRFALREGSGGAGRFRGGEGLIREYEFTAPVTVSILTERRVRAPYGLAGGEPGARGRNALRRRDGTLEELPGRSRVELEAGDRLIIETPGGGGFGRPS